MGHIGELEASEAWVGEEHLGVVGGQRALHMVRWMEEWLGGASMSKDDKEKKGEGCRLHVVRFGDNSHNTRCNAPVVTLLGALLVTLLATVELTMTFCTM